MCPRECKVNRDNGEAGYCLESSNIRLSRAALHMWEEPCISGDVGSGTVFFSGCNLRCVYCQNKEIASGRIGKEISVMRLSEIFLELCEKGALNINLVTPSHYIPQIISALDSSKANGLNIPIVYNTSSYDKVEALKQLEGYIDIYLADFKYMDSELSLRYSNAADYPAVAKAAVSEMVRQHPTPIFDENDILKSGVIVRHMILPGYTKDSKAVIKFLHDTYHDDVLLSIMNQYTPLEYVCDYPEINRKLTAAEYDEVVDFAIDIGVENGYIQEGETQSESFIPSFDYEGVLKVPQ